MLWIFRFIDTVRSQKHKGITWAFVSTPESSLICSPCWYINFHACITILTVGLAALNLSLCIIYYNPSLLTFDSPVPLQTGSHSAGGWSFGWDQIFLTWCCEAHFHTGQPQQSSAQTGTDRQQMREQVSQGASGQHQGVHLVYCWPMLCL